MSNNRATGFVFHELYMWHDTGAASSVFPAGLTIEPGEHAENSSTKRRFRNLLEMSGLLDRLTPVRPRPASEDELARFHTRDYIARIKKLSAERGGDAGDLTPFGTGSFEIAQLAAGGTIRAVELALSGEIANAYALVRPPGHHAERDKAMEKIRDLTCLSDILPTGYHGAVTAGVGPGSTVYVAGAGPVGLAAAASARLLGAAVVIVGDLNPARLAHAKAQGFEIGARASGGQDWGVRFFSGLRWTHYEHQGEDPYRRDHTVNVGALWAVEKWVGANEDVPVYATGPDADLFRGVREQSYWYHAMVEAFGWNAPAGKPAEAPAGKPAR